VSWGDERLRAAQRVLTLGPGLALAHWLRATVFIARSAFGAATEELCIGCAAQDAQPKRSGFPAVGLHLLDGLVHAAHGRLDDAAAALTRELSFADSGQLYARECAANTWYALGAVRLRQLNHEAAEDAFRRALAIAPGHVSAAAALRAEAAAEAALRADVPSSSAAIDAAVGRAILLARANRHAEAARVYHDAVSQAPPGPAGWLLPVEPLLNPLEHRGIWAETLALVRLRAT
jgi:tetratricopeptide (TPR) repeat protein